MAQQFCLRWNNHQPNFISVFSTLLTNETLVDVTLAAEGRHLQAHRVVLSACSTYFQSLFTANPCQHPIVILKDVKFIDLKTMVDFMYYGEVNVSQEQLPSMLKTAEMLKIKGLAEMPESSTIVKSFTSDNKCDLYQPPVADSNWQYDNNGPKPSTSTATQPPPSHTAALSPNSKRKRFKKQSTSGSSCSTEKGSIDQILGLETTPTAMSSPIGGTITKTEPFTFHTDGNSVAVKQLTSDLDVREAAAQSDTSDNRAHSHAQDTQQQALSPTPSTHTRSLVSSQMPQSQVQNIVQSVDNQILGIQTSTQQPVQERTTGLKRGRFLIRQPRVKKEPLDREESMDDDYGGQFLNVPPAKIERQSSEPCYHLLTVPSQTATLVKQHSHPLLPSQLSMSHESNTSHIQSHYPTIHIRVPSESERTHSPDAARHETMINVPKHHSADEPHYRPRHEELRRSSSSPQPNASPTRSRHCPAIRSGPALGCNFCWNTIDDHGRILRRKTKYHCPECQTNLCIVPCFQEFHERQNKAVTSAETTTSTSAEYRG